MLPLRLVVTSLALSGLALPVSSQDHVGCEVAKLLAERPAAGEYFGFDIALDGDTLLVGVPGRAPAEAHVLVEGPRGWELEEVLSEGGPGSEYDYAWSVALSGDAAVVGARAIETAFVYRRTGSLWQLESAVAPDFPSGTSQFGIALAIEGDTLLVGAPYEQNQGAVYVFVHDGATWTREERLVPDDIAVGDRFGIDVSISGDTALFGADWNDSAGADAGAAYVFTRASGQWSQQTKMKASDAEAGDRFGYAVAVSGDTALVGALANADAGPATGAAYFFERSGTWGPPQKVQASDPASGDAFGARVSLDGEVAVINNRYDDGHEPSTGTAHVFVPGAAGWILATELRASDADAFDLFSSEVAVSGDSIACAAVGDSEAGGWTGAVYSFLLKERSGDPYCACPAGICDNPDPAAGCANTTGSGATLSAYGSVSPDLVDLLVGGSVPGQVGLFFEGTTAPGSGAGVAFGDGLRCAGGSIVRIALRVADSAGDAKYGVCFGDPSVSSVTGAGPGDLRYYQFWYRDPAGPCSSGFNTSSGLEIAW